ncbi:hypothetical protein P171DRAFT_478010 [Karstenula rhodostoma CBS 690.94]|uniref:Uncharacterized protein n=1 Tax=Karstenula rhodostoma CBS 690.94 TaxID=1392251 RepID=A0A9P4P672_9PLEO|nr:hypothetical protein P171DRAFT_478010 [Karstenula rhodostoma CBS 690.94]
MRAASFFILAQPQGLLVLTGAMNLTCYCESSLTVWSVHQRVELQATVGDSIPEICGKALDTPNNRSFGLKDVPVVINILGYVVEHSQTSCETALHEIVSDCFGRQGCIGGSVKGQGQPTYEAYYRPGASNPFQDDHSNLVSRGRGTEKTRRPSPHTTRPKKSKTKPKDKSKTTPKTKSHNGKPKQRQRRPKSKVDVETPTKSDKTVGKHTKARASAKIVPTKTCFAAGSSVKLSALAYPDRKDMARLRPSARYFGYTKPDACTSFAFRQQGMLQNEPNVNPKDYQVEHVLEWQTVTDFFTWVRDKKNHRFPDPTDPQKDVDFCKFWKTTWTGAHPQSFSLVPGGPERTAVDHLKWGFPGLENRAHEFAFLHKTLSKWKAQARTLYTNGHSVNLTLCRCGLTSTVT